MPAPAVVAMTWTGLTWVRSDAVGGGATAGSHPRHRVRPGVSGRPARAGWITEARVAATRPASRCWPCCGSLPRPPHRGLDDHRSGGQHPYPGVPTEPAGLRRRRAHHRAERDRNGHRGRPRWRCATSTGRVPSCGPRSRSASGARDRLARRAGAKRPVDRPRLAAGCGCARRARRHSPELSGATEESDRHVETAGGAG